MIKGDEYISTNTSSSIIIINIPYRQKIRASSRIVKGSDRERVSDDIFLILFILNRKFSSNIMWKWRSARSSREIRHVFRIRRWNAAGQFSEIAVLSKTCAICEILKNHLHISPPLFFLISAESLDRWKNNETHYNKKTLDVDVILDASYGPNPARNHSEGK